MDYWLEHVDGEPVLITRNSVGIAEHRRSVLESAARHDPATWSAKLRILDAMVEDSERTAP